MALTGEQSEALCGALCDAFDEGSLAQMVQFKLEKKLHELVTPGPLKQVVFELVKVAKREGWTDALVSGAHAAQPNNPKLLGYCRAHAPNVLAPGRPASLPTGNAERKLDGETTGSVSPRIGSIIADKVVVAEKIDTVNM